MRIRLLIMIFGVLLSFATRSSASSPQRHVIYYNAKGETVERHRPIPLGYTEYPLRAGVDSASLQMITNPPSGDTVIYRGNGKGFLSLTGSVIAVNQTDFAQYIIYTASGEVYMQNPVPNKNTKAWMKGVLQDSVITFEFPQYMAQGTSFPSMKKERFYAFAYQRCNSTADMQYDPCSQQRMQFRIQPSGTVLPVDTSLMLGYSTQVYNPVWSGFGIENMTYEKLPAQVQLPQGAIPESYAIAHSDFWAPLNGDFMSALWSGNEFYFGNWDNMSNMWAKATKDKLTVSLESGQFLGIDPVSKRLVMLYSGEFFNDTVDGQPVQGIRILPSVEFNYNPISKKLTPKVENTGFYIVSRGITSFGSPSIFPQARDLALVPGNPEITGIIPYDGTGLKGQCLMRYSCRSTTGQVLDKKALYMRAFQDGQQIVFEPALWTSLSEPMTEIPFGYNSEGNFDFMSSYCDTYWRYFNASAETLGVQTVYKAGGQVNVSDIVTSKIHVGVDAVTDDDPVGVEYYNMEGMRVSPDCKGILIRRSTYADGKVRVCKIINR